MLRVPQHERESTNDTPPFVLSLVEGLREVFQQSARQRNESNIKEEQLCVSTKLLVKL
jgi:hypothetical protein